MEADYPGGIATPPPGGLHSEPLFSEACRRPPAGRPLLLIHGFTQTARLWGQFGRLLAQDRPVFGLDLPGHGDSAEVIADLPTTGQLVAQVATELGGATPDGRVDLFGYSLGARVALHALIAHPEPFHRAVLLGTRVGIDDPAARAARRARDDTMAGTLERDVNVEQFLVDWLANPMFAGLSASAADHAERLRNTAAGLAASLRTAGAGTQEPLWDDLASISVGTLLLAGADDPRFASIAAAMASAMPNAVLSLVSGAGHAAHLEQPNICARMVGTFLDQP